MSDHPSKSADNNQSSEPASDETPTLATLDSAFGNSRPADILEV
tara:strand:- start:274583 stop:274714 length:132 start_codon:yes stop_codon:yes gene_type:complete